MIKPLKIAIFSGSVPSTTFIEHLIDGVSGHHKVLLFGVSEGHFQYTNKRIKTYITPKSHYKNFFISFYRFFLLLLIAPKSLIKLFKEVRKYKNLYDQWVWFTKFLPIVLYKPDIFHIQWAKDVGTYYFLKDVIGCKIFVSLLGTHINYSPLIDMSLRKQYLEYFPKVDAFHAVSDAIAMEATKYGANAKNIKVIRSPIQYSTFNIFRPIVKSNTTTLNLLSVGRHHWVKGYSYAIDAMAILNAKGITFNYDIIAQGNIPEDLIFQRDRLNLNEKVNFLKGISPQYRLFEVMQNYDALVLSSLSEGIANVVLEAMAIGLPVISTNCGGMAEVVIPNETGWLVPVRNSHEMADAIVELQQTPIEELQRITNNAHHFVKTHYNAEERIVEFLEWYEQ